MLGLSAVFGCIALCCILIRLFYLMPLKLFLVSNMFFLIVAVLAFVMQAVIAWSAFVQTGSTQQPFMSTQRYQQQIISAMGGASFWLFMLCIVGLCLGALHLFEQQIVRLNIWSYSQACLWWTRMKMLVVANKKSLGLYLLVSMSNIFSIHPLLDNLYWLLFAAYQMQPAPAVE